jgi:hypothetical protein
VKQKDLVMLLVAVVIFLAAGYLGYTQLMPKKTSATKAVQVEVVGKFDSTLNQEALTDLQNQSVAKDYDSPVDLNGLNNTAPFGQ